LYVYLELLTS